MNNLRSACTTISVVLLIFLLAVAYNYPIQFGKNSMLFTDYGKFYRSARFVITEKDAYTPIFFHEKSQENGKQKIIKKKLSDNLNPPFFNLAILPLGYLSYAHSFLTWSVLSIIGGLLSVFLLLKKVLHDEVSPNIFFVTALVFFTYYPTFATLQFGQVTLILLPFIVGAWSALQSGRSLLAAFLLAIVTCLKPFFGLFLVYFLVRREWRALLLFCLVSLVCGLLLPMLVFGKQTFLNYFVVLNNIKWLASNWNISLLGLLTRLFGGQELNIALLPITGLAEKLYAILNVVFLMLLIKLLWPKEGFVTTEKIDLDFSATLIIILLTAPLAWIYYFPFLMIPFARLWKIINKYECPAVFPVLIALAIFLSGMPENILPTTAIKLENMVPVFLWACAYTAALLLLLGICFFLCKTLPQSMQQTNVILLPKYLLTLVLIMALAPSFLGIMKIAYNIKMHGHEFLQTNYIKYFISETF